MPFGERHLLLRAGGKRYALRLHRPDYHSKADILSELMWLDALRETGIMVPQAIPARDGESVLTLALADGSTRHAVLFHWIDGEMPTTDVDPKAFQQLGTITARLHQHSRSWQKPEGFQRIIWDHHTMVSEHSHWGAGGCAASRSGRSRHYRSGGGSRRAGAGGKERDRYGLIHADLRLTNLLLHKGETRVIDFDDCGMGWYLHDLAAAIVSSSTIRVRRSGWITGSSAMNAWRTSAMLRWRWCRRC